MRTSAEKPLRRDPVRSRCAMTSFQGDPEPPSFPCWMAPEEIELIEAHLRPEHSMLEWGMGGSTLRFAPQVQHYATIEHDRTWFERLSPHLAPQTEAILREPEWPYEPYQAAEPGQFRDYIDAIHAFDRAPFDVILIDGRARIECLREAARCQTPGGLLFFHDFWLRERYHGQTELIYTRYRLLEALTSTPQTLALFEKR